MTPNPPSLSILFIFLFTFLFPQAIMAQNDCPMWTIGEWGECSEACGNGIRTRSVDCFCDGVLVSDINCDSPKPASTEACNSVIYNWVTGDYGACSEICGEGIQTRSVYCQDCNGNVVSDLNCSGNKPESTQACDTRTYNWVTGDFGACSEICGEGIQTRSVHCQDCNGSIVSDLNCSGSKPESTQACDTRTYNWVTGDFGACEVNCGEGTQTRTVVCQDCNGATVADVNCGGGKPAESQTCTFAITFAWEAGPYGPCSVDCGSGVRTRTVLCRSSEGNIVDDCNCSEEKLAESEPCYMPGCGVGIGTTNPTSDLHIKGSLRLENGTQGVGKVLVSDENGNATWQDLPVTSLLDITGQEALINSIPKEAMIEVIDDNGHRKTYANPSLLIIYLVDKINQQEEVLKKQERLIDQLNTSKN